MFSSFSSWLADCCNEHAGRWTNCKDQRTVSDFFAPGELDLLEWESKDSAFLSWSICTRDRDSIESTLQRSDPTSCPIAVGNRRVSSVRDRPRSAVRSIFGWHSARRDTEWSPVTRRGSWSGRRQLWQCPNALWSSCHEAVWWLCRCRRTFGSFPGRRARVHAERWCDEECRATRRNIVISSDHCLHLPPLRSNHRCHRCSSSVSASRFARRSVWPVNSCSLDCQQWDCSECPRNTEPTDDRPSRASPPVVESRNRCHAERRTTSSAVLCKRAASFTIRVAWLEMFLREIRQLCRIRILFVVRRCFSKIVNPLHCNMIRLISSLPDEMIGSNLEMVKSSLSYLLVSKMNRSRWMHCSWFWINIFDLAL